MSMTGSSVGPRGIRAALVAALLLALASGASAAPPARAMFHDASYGNTLEARLLATHNRERAAFGAAPLQWDPNLAIAAASYGPALSAIGRLQHSNRANRPGQAENLWMGTRGGFAPEAMVGAWNSEKRYLRPGTFPFVSSTGNWQDVAHFTQVIWKGTTHVGCAVHRDARWDFLICRYSPKGNVDGRLVP
jgi:hypothetical protein